MIDQIRGLEDAKLYKYILAIVSAVYRPITVDELPAFVDMPTRVASEYEALSEIKGLCSSFLTLRGRMIFFIYQSAKDFLVKELSNKMFLKIEDLHYTMFSRSLQVMSKTL
jgi:hypothetical protein